MAISDISELIGQKFNEVVLWFDSGWRTLVNGDIGGLTIGQGIFTGFIAYSLWRMVSGYAEDIHYSWSSDRKRFLKIARLRCLIVVGCAGLFIGLLSLIYGLIVVGRGSWWIAILDIVAGAGFMVCCSKAVAFAETKVKFIDARKVEETETRSQEQTRPT